MGWDVLDVRVPAAKDADADPFVDLKAGVDASVVRSLEVNRSREAHHGSSSSYAFTHLSTPRLSPRAMKHGVFDTIWHPSTINELIAGSAGMSSPAVPQCDV